MSMGTYAVLGLAIVLLVALLFAVGKIMALTAQYRALWVKATRVTRAGKWADITPLTRLCQRSHGIAAFQDLIQFLSDPDNVPDGVTGMPRVQPFSGQTDWGGLEKYVQDVIVENDNFRNFSETDLVTVRVALGRLLEHSLAQNYRRRWDGVDTVGPVE